MGRPYSVDIANTAVGATNFPQLCIYNAGASPAIRAKIYEFILGSSATPADQVSRVTMNRITTAAPTGGSAPTAAAIETADPATGMTTRAAATGGCTLSTELMVVSVNLRATFRWVAVPGMEIVIPATQYAGGGLVYAAQSAAYNPDVCLMWQE